MVAYSFQPRFIEPIRAGLKRQTIRAHRKRHARPGEAIQLYAGMRTRHCRKIIDDPVCTAVEPIEIAVPEQQPGFVHNGFQWRGGVGTDWAYLTEDFAAADGFEGVLDMWRFWRRHHGPGLFRGVVIRWKPDAAERAEDGGDHG